MEITNIKKRFIPTVNSGISIKRYAPEAAIKYNEYKITVILLPQIRCSKNTFIKRCIINIEKKFDRTAIIWYVSNIIYISSIFKTKLYPCDFFFSSSCNRDHISIYHNKLFSLERFNIAIIYQIRFMCQDHSLPF